MYEFSQSRPHSARKSIDFGNPHQQIENQEDATRSFFHIYCRTSLIDSVGSPTTEKPPFIMTVASPGAVVLTVAAIGVCWALTKFHGNRSRVNKLRLVLSVIHSII